MIKERISLSGDLKNKIKQLMIYAGWYEGRKVDISIALQYYAERGVPMMKSTQRFYHKYFGLCCQWYFSGGTKGAADFEFGLFPYLINGIKDHYYTAQVWISEFGKLYAKYEYQDEIECFSDIFALIERELKKCTIDSVAMKTVEALDNKL